MKHSIKKQLAYIFIALMAGTLVSCWFINNTFLEGYYANYKQQTLMNAYQLLNNAGTEGKMLEEEFQIPIQKICTTGNIDFLVLDPEGKMELAFAYDKELLKKKLYESIFERSEEEKLVLEQTNQYVLQKRMDTRAGMEYFELWGTLDNGSVFIMRTALEGIRESVKISNRFLAYVGVLAILFSAFLIWFVSRKITEPILELADISRRMTDLDFEAKYKSGGENEITLLGNHINQLSETLEKTISELKTANNELQIDIDKKEKIDEMRKEFLSNVSHELKTPIALIQGYAEGLQECINDDPAGRDFYCEVIIDEANRMNNMVKKLLSLNQLEFGNDIVALERFDICALVRNMIQSSEILLQQKEIKIICNVNKPIYVWADEFKVEEVFMNYFSNAINHAEHEKIIEVKIIEKEECVRISVFNTGKPIPEEAVEHVWTKFYKVDKARTREYGGSGVGLSIVKAIMESFNRDYGVVNYDNGVEFWFELDNKN